MYPVIESPSEVECSIDHVLAVAGEEELPLHRVQHLLGGRDASRRDQDEKRDVVRRRRGERARSSRPG